MDVNLDYTVTRVYSGNTVAADAAPPPVHQAIDRLASANRVLSEALDALGVRLVDVLTPQPHTESRGERPDQAEVVHHECPLAERVGDLALSVGEQAERVRSLTARLEV